MTDRPCLVRTRGDEVCGNPLAPGRTICAGCGTVAGLDLDDVPEVLAQLDVTLTRQDATGSTAGGTSGCPDGCEHGPLDDDRCRAGARLTFDERASSASLALRLCLHGWARVWDEQRPAPELIEGPAHPIPTCRDTSCWQIAVAPKARAERDRQLSSAEGQAQLLGALAVIGARNWAPDFASELRAAVREAWDACDRPPEQRVVGRCRTDGCGRPVYAREGAQRARCVGCGVQWDTHDLREASLRDASDALRPAADLARILAVPPGTVRSWVARGRLTAAEVNTAGQPLYRVSDGYAAKTREDTTT